MFRNDYDSSRLTGDAKRFTSPLPDNSINIKRLMDVVFSLLGIIICSPFLPLIALLIKLDSKGSVFYLSDRVGIDFKGFKMWKFRTMIDTPVNIGESVCPQFDPRVTPVGRFLRRTKINELPQLINILKGEMTFVGPRPEAPDLAALYPENAKRVFSVKPGLVGPAAILGRNEEEVYPPGVDVKKYYIESILPSKNRLDLEYIANQSLFKDIKYIFQGVKETVVGSISRRHIHDNWSQICLLLSDAFIIACSYLCAAIFYSWHSYVEVNWAFAFFTLSIVILSRLAWNIYFSMYSSLIRYLSYHDIAGVFKGVTAATVFLLINAYALEWIHYPGGVALIDWVSLIILLSSMRLALRLYWDTKHRKTDQRGMHRILIYGVCDEGNAACRAFTSEGALPFEIVGFIDDAPSTFGKTVNGKKVLGDRHHIGALARLYRVEEVLIAKPGIDADKLSEIEDVCDKAGLKSRIWNPLEAFGFLNRHITQQGTVKFSDMIAPRRFHSDTAALRNLLTAKTVLMNGSGGALGLELCRQTLHSGCKRLIILERYESYLNELVAALMKESHPAEIVPALIDGEEVDSLEEIFMKYLPNFVVHAGMRKYTPFLRVDLGDVGRINYLRTFNLAKAALKFHCDWFVMISAFMVSNGGSFVTDSLRVAEVSLEHFFRDTNTRFIVTRICDVFENRGGIISILENQIRNLDPLTLPSPDAQAYIISKDYGAQFILQSLVDAAKDEFDGKAHIFTCDAGLPIPLLKLSEQLANIYGLKLGADVGLRYTEPFTDSAFTQPPAPSPPVLDKPERFRTRDAELKTFLEDLLHNNADGTRFRDWKEWTQRAIKACEPIS